MVKKGKKSKKKGASLDELFSDSKGDDQGGWQTGSAAMLLDEDQDMQVPAADPAAAAGQQPAQSKKKKGKGKGRAGQQDAGDMDTGEAYTAADGSKPGSKAAGAVSKVPGLGVVQHSMKRGDRTAKQKKRKVQKLAKAVARSEQAGVRIDVKQKRKLTKVGLKNVY